MNILKLLKKNNTTRVYKRLAAGVIAGILLALSPLTAGSAFAQQDTRLELQFPMYSDKVECAVGGAVDGAAGAVNSATGSDLDRFLQAFAYQESSGNPTAESKASSASGKYQFLDGTWQSVTAQYYPPGHQYTRAKDAPESVQDATMYIWYAQKQKTYNNIFDMAVSHFLPKAVGNPALLNTIPAGNVITPQQYGDKFMESFNSNIGAGISLSYTQAPDFAQYLAAVGGTPVASATTTPSTTGAKKPVIVLDPGHGGPNRISRTDPATGLMDGDYQNLPEAQVVFDVATIAKQQLEAAGYQVVLTKNDVNESVFLRDRANIANFVQAAMAVSIHTQGDRAFGSWGEIYTQKVGLSRGTGAATTTFNNAEVAQKSQEYAQTMATERNSSEMTGGAGISVKDNSFDGREGIEPGNIPLVQLFANVPWIYLEAGGGASNQGLDQGQKDIYAKAIVAGVQKSVPADSTGNLGQVDECSDSGVAGEAASTGNIVATALKLAWEVDGHDGQLSRDQAKKEYQTAFDEFYLKLGGSTGQNPYSDCGVFVGTTMRASGADPDYPLRGTAVQKAYLEKSPKYTIIRNPTIDQLQPGDVMVYNKSPYGHTLIYTGPNGPQGIYMVAQASLNDHVPEVGKVGSVNYMLKNSNVIAARLK